MEPIYIYIMEKCKKKFRRERLFNMMDGRAMKTSEMKVIRENLDCQPEKFWIAN